jgi:hypothetical protein
MVRYPIGIQTFSEIRTKNYLYVDKTPFVYELARNRKYVFLSRPRRFGKSLLVSTFDAYFRGKKELFKGLAIEEMEKEWTEYPVVHFSLAMAKLGTVENLNNQINMQLGMAEKAYGVENGSGDITTRFYTLVTNLYAKTGKQVVVLIDEYDAPLLNVLHDPERLEPMRAALQAFYSPLKDLDPYLRFVFITGISKFSQLSIFSQINNLYKISMMPEYSTICGITQRELEENFKEGIQKLSEKNNWTTDQVISELKQRYDGYHFSEESDGVYNPFSLLYAMDTKRLGNYWFTTGTPSFLVRMLKKFNTFIPSLEGSEAKSAEFDAPTEDMHSILPLFYQSGYLTIKGYEPAVDTYTLGYPNEEVKVGLLNSLAPYYVSPDINTTNRTLDRMYLSLLKGDVDSMLSYARSFFAGIPYQEGTLKDAPATEGHFTAMLYVMFSMLSAYCFSQVRTAKGRMDILLKLPSAIYVMELKMDGSVDDALRQIDDKGYTIPYETDGRPIVKVGINFSSEERTIKEWKVRE